MRITYRTVVVLVMLLILAANPALMAWGGPPPGRWEKVAAMKPGRWMLIHTEDGAKHNHRFMSLNDDFLVCRNAFNEEVLLEKASIRKIIIENSGRYRKQGALVGALGGAAGGLALMGINTSHSTQSVLLFTGITAVLGAGAGFIIGAAASSSDETIYIAKDKAMAE